MKRIVSLDYARGWTVLLMAPVHTVLLYSNDATREGPLGLMTSFLAEDHGAPVLMTLMGIGIALKPGQTMHAIVLRSTALFGLGLVLNVLKFLFPLAAVGLPVAFLEDIEIASGSEGAMQLLRIGDIFHFAGIATLIVSLIAKIGNSFRTAPLAIAIVLVIAYIVGQSPGDYFFGGPPQVFFPVFPWLVYPLLGLGIGAGWKEQIPGFFCLFLGIGVLFCGIGLSAIVFGAPAGSFYKPAMATCAVQMGTVILCLGTWHWLSINLPPNRFFVLLQWFGKHITITYCLQWIIVCWALPFVGYHELNLPQSVLAITVTTTLTLSLTYLTTKIKSHGQPNI